MLEQLPPPPSSKTGWPWTEESDALPPLQPDNNPWPRISIVTPSFNQGQFIEETIRSILLQNYPGLEYIIIDGGSTDNSLGIIRKYEPWITYWISESDNGQSHAINKGFKKCTGEMVNWICSDDMLCKNALYNLSPLLTKKMNCMFICRGFRIDQNSKILNEINPSTIKNIKNLLDIKNYWRKYDSIMQQSCIYPLDEIKKFGYLNENNHFTMDYELWGWLLIAEIPVVPCSLNLGIFRWYEGQKTSQFNTVTNSLVKTAMSLILVNKKFSRFTKSILIIKVLIYFILYYYHTLRSIIGIKRRLKSLLNVSPGTLYK